MNLIQIRLIQCIVLINLCAGIPCYAFATDGLESQYSVYASEPTFPASFLTVDPSVCNQAELNWISGDGARRLVIARANGPVSQMPVDGTTYNAATNFGGGSNLGDGNYVVYNSNGTNVVVTGLNGGVHYYFAVFEFNGTGFGINYLTSVYPSVDTIATGIVLSVVAADTALCVGESTTIEANGANSYFWNPSTGLSSTTDSVVTATPASTTTYTVYGSDTMGCQVSQKITITVSSLPSVSLSQFPDHCRNDAPFALSGGLPSGGVYNGPGVTGGIFDPAAAGSGILTLYYTYTNSQGCSNTASNTIRIFSPPSVTLGSFSDQCSNGSPLTLTGGSPSGGIYSGTGVSGNQFDPSAAGSGTHDIIYTFTNINGCSSSDTSSITVHSPPNVSLSSFSGVCVDAPAFSLSGGSPPGGTYSGIGVSGGSFTASVAGTGSTTITYSYTDGDGCTSSDSRTIQVYGLPTVTVAPFDPVCEGSAPVALSGGSPPGGTYSGPGVTNNEFNAQVTDTGIFILTYTYVDGNSCVNSDSSAITVNALPVVTLSPFQDVCVNTGPVALIGGNPSPGIYSGTGVGGSTFYTGIAGAGIHTIQYSYTDSNGCSNSTSGTITVHDIPAVSLGPDTLTCSDVPIVLTPGAGYSSYFWNTGSNASFITVDTTGHGIGTFPFWVLVTNAFGCVNRDTIAVTFDPCSGISGPDAALMQVYPNPFSGTCTVVLHKVSDVRVYTMEGRLAEEKCQVTGVLSIGNSLPFGHYLLDILQGGKQYTFRLLKSR